MSDERVRTFIAIELPEDIKAELARLQDELKNPKKNIVKWVAAQGIHLTLKFLGNINASQIKAISQAIDAACLGEKQFHLSVGELGVFPNYKRPRVLWVAVSGQVERLLKIQRQIDEELSKLGFIPEKRPFSPHITLARVNEKANLAEISEFGEKIKAMPSQKSYEFEVKSVCLMRSQLYPTGAVYSRLSQSNLQNN